MPDGIIIVKRPRAVIRSVATTISSLLPSVEGALMNYFLSKADEGWSQEVFDWVLGKIAANAAE